MKSNLQQGQIFWLVIPHFKEKLKPRPFLLYEINTTDYVFLCITGIDRREKIDYIPQYLLIRKPSGLYKPSFVNLNTLVFIKHDLFTELLNKLGELKKQGQIILPEDFNEITREVDDCFNNEKFRGNRYKIRVE
jgi:hypothetical protein